VIVPWTIGGLLRDLTARGEHPGGRGCNVLILQPARSPVLAGHASVPYRFEAPWCCAENRNSSPGAQAMCKSGSPRSGALRPESPAFSAWNWPAAAAQRSAGCTGVIPRARSRRCPGRRIPKCHRTTVTYGRPGPVASCVQGASAGPTRGGCQCAAPVCHCSE